MNCREFADFLSLYFDNDLPAEEHAEFDRHLAECPACVAYLDGYRATVASLRRSATNLLNSETAPEELVRAIVSVRSAKLSTPPSDGGI